MRLDQPHGQARARESFLPPPHLTTDGSADEDTARVSPAGLVRRVALLEPVRIVNVIPGLIWGDIYTNGECIHIVYISHNHLFNKADCTR